MAVHRKKVMSETKSPLAGMRCDYLIGTDAPPADPAGRFKVLSFDTHAPLPDRVCGAYVNLLVEKYNDKHKEPARFRPYLPQKGTAADPKYNEGIPDPSGPGWEKNLREQLERRKLEGFTIIGDLDNPDTFRLKTVKRAYEIAAGMGFKLICKNPNLECSSIEGDSDAKKREPVTDLVRHDAVIGIIVEHDKDVTVGKMDELRKDAKKPDLPVWFVSYDDGEDGKEWAQAIANKIKHAGYGNMSVTYSKKGEYKSSDDILPV